MDPIHRSSLVEQTEAVILDGLIQGQWSGFLPGIRILSRALKVSPPTVQAAVQRLTDKGILISHGPRRRLEIAITPDQPVRNDHSSGVRKVICLTEESLPDLTHSRLELISLFHEENPSWDVRHHVLAHAHAQRPRRQWDVLLRTEQPDALIVFGGRVPFAEWSLNRGIPTVFFGGYAGNLPVPCVGSDLKNPVIKSFEELISLGHSHICLPCFGVFPELVESVRTAIKAIYEKHGLHFDPSWHVPSSDQNNADVVMNTMMRVSRNIVPTAIICLGWKDFITIQSFLHMHRLTIPEDVSIILISASDAVSWYRPTLSYFGYQLKGAVRQASRWIEGPMPTGPVSHSVSGRLVPGDSVAPPRQAK